MAASEMPIGQIYLRLILSRWKLVSALVVGCTLAAWLFSVLVLANKPTFDSAARLNIVPTSEELGYANRFVRGSTFDGGSVLLQTYAEFAHTRPVVGPIVDRFIAEQARAAGISEAEWERRASVPNPFSPGAIISWLNYGATPPAPIRDQIIDALIKYTLIENVEGTYLIRITVSWDDPKAAAWFANALADAIIARARNEADDSRGKLSGSLASKLTAKKAELAEVLARSRGMKASIGVVDLDRQKQALFEARIGELSQLTSDRASLKLNQGQVAGLQKETSGKLSPAQQQLEQSLALERPRAAGMAAGISVRERRIADLDAQIAALGRSEDAIKTLDASAAALQAEVAALTERTSFTELENVANAPRIQLIERAVAPLVRSSPKVLLNTALGFIAGCALAACALLLLGGAPEREAQADEDEDFADAGLLEEPAAEAPEPEPVVVPIRTAAPPPPPAPEPAQLIRRGHAGSHALALEPEEDLAPAPRPAAVTRLFPHILPQPADGPFHDAAQQAAIAPALAQWLEEALVPDGRPLVVASDNRDEEAQNLYRLIYHHLRQHGAAVRCIDGTAVRTGLTPGTPGTKPLVYAGGMRESADLGTLLRGLDHGAVLLATSVMPDGSAVVQANACRAMLAGITPLNPHVVAVSG